MRFLLSSQSVSQLVRDGFSLSVQAEREAVRFQSHVAGMQLLE